MRISALLDLAFGIAAGALALVATPCALALALGDAMTQSALGQPLRVAIPISVTADRPLSPACVHVIADASGASGPPRLLTGRVTIDRGAAEARLVVTTARPVDDPVVRLAVQAGCDGSTRRDYMVLLDPPVAGAVSVSAPVSAPVAPPQIAMPESRRHDAHPAAPAAAAHSPVVSRERLPDVAPSLPIVAAVSQQPAVLLSSPRGSSFIPEAAAAGLPRASSTQVASMPNDSSPGLAPWWPLGVALAVVGALALWLLPIGRRHALEAPAWMAPTACTEPNRSVSSESRSRTLGRSGHFAAMTEPGPGFPRGNTTTTTTTRAGSAPPATAAKPQPAEDPRFAEFEADLVEERTIRAEWAKAMNDGSTDIGGDSILKAIDDAERAIQGVPAHPAQVALDRSLDDELLPDKKRG